MKERILSKIKGYQKSAMPTDVKPMLATLVEKPLSEDGWLYEIKWDGFRALAYLNKNQAELRSRNNKSFNAKFYPVYEALKKWKINAVVDGEIIVIRENGHPDFSALQTWRSEADGDLVFYVFDLIWCEGYNLMDAPLTERREILKNLIPKNGVIKLSQNFNASGSELLSLAAEMGLEGIIAKKKVSKYKPDARTKDWLKIKNQKHQEVVIAGYTRNENSPRKFSALIAGIYEGGELVPIEPIGTGFSLKMQDEILKKLNPLITKKCPFSFVPDFNKASRFRPNPPQAEVTWVKPNVVAEISYRTVSSDGQFRHPSFRGLREDKKAKEVVWEKPQSKVNSNWDTKKQTGIVKPHAKRDRKTLLNPTDKTQVRSINNYELKFTNLDKIYWPKGKITKRDLLNYYYQAAPYILPYLKDRPQTLNRFPNGINASSFYQKDVKGKVPGWIETFTYYSEADEREKEFFVCTNEASLLYSVNLGCIEMNPWNSRITKPDNPDWCIIDLDPDKNKFEHVIEAAKVTKEVLDVMGIPSYCKTSGSTGLHIYIPLGTKYDYEDSKEFARAIVKVVHAQLPLFTSIERLTSKRKGKIYLDFLQNRPQATVAAAYSLRPKPYATVSMPLHWEELKKGLRIENFTINNSIERLKEQGDIFKGVLGKGIDIKKSLEKLRKAF